MSEYERLTYYLDEQCTMIVMPQRKERIKKYIERLAELEDKLESGQLVELPCLREISFMGQKTYELLFVGKSGRVYSDLYYDFQKEAAEARLKELHEGKQ